MRAALLLAAAFCCAASVVAATVAQPTREALAARCEAAALIAARAEGVPERLMRAVALAETGRRLDGAFRPWPWTVNMEGEGRWFDDPDSLLDWVRVRQRQGARSFDLGCFQVNHRWHGDEFDGLEHMLDPESNALYAARFLRELHAETGSWETAAGHYHSRTPALAERYRSRVMALMDRLEDAPPGAAMLAAADAAATRAINGEMRAGPGATGGPLIVFALVDRGAAPGGSLASASQGSASGIGLLVASAGAGLLRQGTPLFGPEPTSQRERMSP